MRLLRAAGPQAPVCWSIVRGTMMSYGALVPYEIHRPGTKCRSKSYAETFLQAALRVLFLVGS